MAYITYIEKINKNITSSIDANDYQNAYDLWKQHQNLIDIQTGYKICLKLGRVISYSVNDRLGNKLFVYFATKIIAHNNDLHYFPYMFSNNQKERKFGCFGVSNNVIESLLSGRNKIYPEPDTVIIINEWCQTDLVLLNPLTKTLFTKYNNDIIDNNITVASIYNSINSYKCDFDRNDLVLHLRLADFNHGQLIKVEFIKKLLNTLSWNNFYIICETPRQQYEIEYIKILEEYNPILIHGELYEDLARIYNAPRIICSNSTLCWIFSSIGMNYISWVPCNKSIVSYPSMYTPVEFHNFIWHNYMLHQNVRKVNINSLEYEIEYQKEIYK